MVSRIAKKQNPQTGFFSIRYRDKKGRYTKTLSTANSFHYVLKNGDLSRKIEIPKEIKKVADKKLFIKESLFKIYKSQYDRKRKSEERKAKEARRSGKIYRPKEIAPMEQALNLSKKERESLERKGYKIERGDILYRVDRDKLKKRRDKSKEKIEEITEIQKGKKVRAMEYYVLPPIIPRTSGSATPLDKDFQYMKDKKGKTIDWYKHQLSTGLIKKDDTQSSIMYNIVRNLKKVMMNDFKMIKDMVLGSRQTNLLKNVIVRMAAVTDLEDHEDFLYDEDNYFQFDLRDNIRTIADSVSFKAAVLLLQLLNKDMEGTDDKHGGVTSDEKFTVIKSDSTEYAQQKDEKFIVFPYIIFEFTRLPIKSSNEQ